MNAPLSPGGERQARVHLALRSAGSSESGLLVPHLSLSETPLHQQSAMADVFVLIRNGDIDGLARRCSDRSVLTSRDESNATPLIHAAALGSLAAVKTLASAGALLTDSDAVRPKLRLLIQLLHTCSCC